MFEALELDGQPIETDWPYLDDTPSDPSTWGPPTTLGVPFKRKGNSTAPSWETLTAHLVAHAPVVLLLQLSRSFYRPAQGVVAALANENPDPTRRHAVVAVGLGEINGEQAVLVRNSWGEKWGLAGHAWLTASFVKPRLFGIATLEGS